MKKIIFILLFCILMINAVSAIDSTNWDNITVKEHIFKIPPKYNGGSLNVNSYQINNWNTFAILCVDTYLENNYGFEADNYGPGIDLEINNHPTRYFCGYNSYEKTNLSRIYFPVGNSIYCISWQSNNLTEDITEIISTSESSEISSNDFYNILDESLENYLEEEEMEENTYFPSYSNTPTNSQQNDIMKYYFFYKLGQYSRR